MRTPYIKGFQPRRKNQIAVDLVVDHQPVRVIMVDQLVSMRPYDVNRTQRWLQDQHPVKSPVIDYPRIAVRAIGDNKKFVTFFEDSRRLWCAISITALSS
jgi:hypothetical protein